MQNNYKNIQFTKKLEDMIWQMQNDDDNKYDIDALDFLSTVENFRPFGYGLTDLIIKHGYIGNTNCTKSKIKFLSEKLKDEKIYISELTIRNWFENKYSPDSSEKSRLNMFKICFALKLSSQETTEFFNKIYLNRSFNIKRIDEFIYLYCMNSSKSYNEAKKIISKVNITKNIETKEIFTHKLYSQTKNINNDNLLIEYINNNLEFFNTDNYTAKKEIFELIDKIKGNKITEGLLQKEFCYTPLKKRKNSISNDLMLSVISNISTENYRKIKSILNKSGISNAIKVNFPTGKILSDIKNNIPVSSDAIRKMLIFLKFYTYWADALVLEREGKTQTKYDYDSFISETDDLLYTCGMGLLYAVNPYDWLFLYCSASNSANEVLDKFRDILAEITLKF